MNPKTKLALGLLGILILVVSLWKVDKDYGTFGGWFGGKSMAANGCFPLSLELNPNGTYAQPSNLICKDGVWVNESKSIGSIEKYCEEYYKLITITYTEEGAVINKTEAKGNEICINGKIITSPSTCGDYKCGSGENEDNCWVDCGIIQDWRSMKDEIGLKPELNTYLQSESAFDFNNPEVDALVDDVEATKPKTPFIAVKTLTRLISEKISYVPGGVAGNVQCGETPVQILDRGTGNCVDYSTVMVATLRHGFYVDGIGRVSIPARQVAGCLNGYATWKAVEYNILDDVAHLRGTVLGHSWVEVYVGNDRWVLADPTTNTALAKSWFGYHKVAEVSGQQMCYVPIEDSEWCTIYSTTGGDSY